MPGLNANGSIFPLKKDDGGLTIRLDCDEFGVKEEGGKISLFGWVKGKSDLPGVWVPDDCKFAFPGAICVTLNPEKPCQKFLSEQLKALDKTKVYRGFVDIQDKQALYEQANANPAIAEVLKMQVCNLTEHPRPSLIQLGSLSVPKGNGNERAKYDPMAKFVALKTMLGTDTGETLIEMSAWLNGLDEGHRETILRLIDAVL